MTLNQKRDVTTRRTLQQIGHCVAEALSVVEHDEDPRCAIDDLDQAKQLISKVMLDIGDDLE